MRISIVWFMFVVISCSPKKDTREYFSKDDPTFKEASKLAQDSLPFFIDTFNKFNEKKEYNFFIKTELQNNGDAEHIWTKPFTTSNNKFRCILDSNPKSGIGYKFGDTLTVDFANIEDFMIILGDSVVGNYLQKELKKTPREQLK